MAELTRQEIGAAGLITPTYAAVSSGGDSVVNDDDTFLFFKNSGSAVRAVTIAKQKATVRVQGLGDVALADITFNVPITTGEVMVKAPPAFYNDANGKLAITYGAVGASVVTVAALKLSQQ